MRRALVAALPLALLVDHAAAFAATTISSGQSTPVQTSTTGDLTIAAGGSITPTTATPAVTLNSSNSITNNGAISSSNVNGSVGVLLQGGNTGSLTNTGSITINETFTPSDSANSDGIVEAPFASGTGRYGILLSGPGALTGNITNTGTIAVQGNSSYGVSLESQLAGALSLGGTVALTGDNGAGVRELAGVTGPVSITGAVSAKGQNSTAVDLEGDVGGRLSVYSALTSTGYSSTTRPTAGTPLTNVEKTPADVEQGGSALIVGGNVADGVYIGGAPAGTITGTTADVNGDGTADGAETTGTVTTFGSAPAVVVGAANKTITLGTVAGADLENVAQPANAYGFINRGTILGSGVYDGVAATGLQIGGQTGGAVTLSGGLRNVGTIEGTSYAAGATGLVVGGGATIPELRNEGTIEGVITASTGANLANAVTILGGAQVGTITNTGALLATATGDNASASVVVDQSGSVSRVTNEGAIAAALTPTAIGDVLTGRRIALDLSANQTGVTLVQQTNPNVGVVFGNASGTTATTTSTATATVPSINGDVLLGNGPNTVQLLAGSLNGALSLGSGTGGSLTLDNGATFTGDLTFGGSGLEVNIANGTLTDSSPSTINASSLNVGAASKLTVAIDPANSRSTQFVVSGPATFAAGSQLGFTTKSLLIGAQNFVLVTSPNLGFSGSALTLTTAPYLLVASLATGTNAQGLGTLSLDVRQKTTIELGLNRGESAAFGSIYAALANDAAVQTAVFAPTNQSDFKRTYDRLLPDYGGGVFDLVDATQRQISDLALAADLGPRQAGRIWTKEFVVGSKQDGDATNQAFNTTGFGITGGAEAEQGPLGALGVDGAFTVGQAHSAGGNRVDVYGINGQLYWRLIRSGLRLGATAGGGYNLESGERDFSGLDGSGTAFTRTAKSNYSGYTAAARGSAAYEFTFGRFYVRPQGRFDYVRLQEDAFTEKDGGGALDLAVNSRTGHELSGVASTSAGWTFGGPGQAKIRPEIEVGVRDVFDGDPGSTTAHFVAGGNSFTLLPNSITGAGVVARAALNAETEYYRIGIEASGEEIKGKDEAAVLVRASASF